jgi:hypothetical protein
MMLHLLSAGRKRSPRTRAGRLALERLEERCLPSADPVLFWNQVALQAAVTDHGIGAPGLQFGPTRTSRALAIVSGAVYDAVNSIHPQYEPYLIQLPAPKNASIDAAVAEAAYTTLVNLYPYQQPYFQAELKASLQGIPLVPMLEGLVVGGVIGADYNLTRANDGSQIDAPGHQPPYTFGQQPGQWRSDPLHPNATPLTPDWGLVTPFVVQSATQFGAPPPPAITSLAYAQAYEQVKAIGAAGAEATGARTENQTNIGFFWGYDAQPGLCAPVRFYNQIVGDIAQQAHNTVEQNARLFALVNFAEADAAITCWNDKYRYDLWRPVTAIRENDPGTGPTGLGSGNPYLVGQGDPAWVPLGAPADNHNGTNFTPPFPSYTSGHATIGAATFKVLEDFYHSDTIPNGGKITIISDEFNTVTIDQNGHARPLLPRTYNSFSQMAGENAQSRIYLGIHWHFDAVEGIRSGDGIGDYVFTHALLPLHGSVTTLPSMDPEAQIQLAVSLEDAAANGGAQAPGGALARPAAAAPAGFDQAAANQVVLILGPGLTPNRPTGASAPVTASPTAAPVFIGPSWGPAENGLGLLTLDVSSAGHNGAGGTGHGTTPVSSADSGGAALGQLPPDGISDVLPA